MIAVAHIIYLGTCIMTVKPKSLKEQRLAARVAKRARRTEKYTLPKAIEAARLSTNEENQSTMDILKGENPIPLWLGVTQLQNDCWALLKSPADEIHNILEHPAAVEFKKTAPYTDVLTLMKQVQQDTGRFKQRLESIAALHAGKEGDAKDPDEHFEAMSIGTEYYTWLSDFTAEVMPIVSDITGKVMAFADEAEATVIAERVEG
jgi:hypothetical protein